MKKYTKYLILIVLLLMLKKSFGQIDSVIYPKSIMKNHYSHDNVFTNSIGYNFSKINYIDVGLRYYRFKNDGKDRVSFGSATAGCEFSILSKDQFYIPYIGWQYFHYFLAYGLRSEAYFSQNKYGFGTSAEIGISMFDFLRITGGYRLNFGNSHSFDLSSFRFSIIFAAPLSVLFEK